jgi:FMN reductase
MSAPYIVGIGGTSRSNSTCELALRYVLKVAAEAGARTALIAGPALQVGMYEPGCSERSEGAQHLVRHMALADGLILVSPGYQAAVTTLGALRNVVHALRGWPRPMGAAINSSEGPVFAPDGSCQVKRVAQMLEIISEEIFEFAVSQGRSCKVDA